MSIFNSNNTFFYLLFILILCFVNISEQSCHYSCTNCTTVAYTSCFGCSDSTNNLTILEDPMKINPIYMHSIYPTGICTGKVPADTNLLGVLLLIVSIIGILITKSFRAFFMISTLQTIGLFGLLEIAWVQPGSFILQSFQYLMPINQIMASSKQADQHLLLFGYYRLDKFMINSSNQTLIALFIINSILFAFIITLYVIIRYNKNKQKQVDEQQRLNGKKNQINENILVPQFTDKSQNLQKNNLNDTINVKKDQLNEQQLSKCGLFRKRVLQKIRECLILRKLMHLSIYIFFFFVQQTVLTIMIGAVFSISALQIAIWSVYFIQIITLITISYFEFQNDKQVDLKKQNKQEWGLSLFISQESMLILWVKKVVQPLGVVLPFNMQYIFFIVYLVFFVIQGSVDSQSPKMKMLSRITLFKLMEICLTVTILSFFFNERNGTDSGNAVLVSTIFTILAVVFMVTLGIQMIFSFIGIFFGINNSVKNQDDLINQHKVIQFNNTQQTINQFDEKNLKMSNVFDETVQFTRRKQQNSNKKELQIIELEDESNNEVQQQKYKNKNILVVEKTQSQVRKQSNIDKNKQIINEKIEKQIKINTMNSNNQTKSIDTNHTVQVQPQIVQIDQNDNQNEEQQKETKKKQKRRIMDPQLRKRYGLK